MDIKTYKDFLLNKNDINVDLFFRKNDYELDVMVGVYNYFYYNKKELEKNIEKEEKIYHQLIYLFNDDFENDFLLNADVISGDLEYVSSCMCEYFNVFPSGENIAIIDESKLFIKTKSPVRKIKLTMFFLMKTMEELKRIGVKYISFMTKGLIMDLDNSERIKLFEQLIRKNFIPIYQDSVDIVFVKRISDF